MGKLKRKAHRYASLKHYGAKQEVRRQIGSSRREQGDEIASLRSMAGALQDSLGQARRQLKSMGLNGRDLQIALQEMANRGVDVVAGARLAERQTIRKHQAERQDLRGKLVDIRSTQSADEALKLDQLREKRDDRTESLRHSLMLDVQKRMQQGQSVGGAAGGADPKSLRAAQVVTSRLYHLAKAAGRPPRTSAQWTGFVDAVSKYKGVNDQAAATQAVRQFQNQLLVKGIKGNLAVQGLRSLVR